MAINSPAQNVGGLIGQGIVGLGNALKPAGTLMAKGLLGAAQGGVNLVKGIGQGLAGGGVDNSTSYTAPTDAPIPAGIANFKMGSQATNPASKVTPPSNTLPSGATAVANSPQPTAPVSTPAGSGTPAPSGPGITTPGVVANNTTTDASTQAALASAAAQSPGGSQYVASTTPQIQNGGLWGGVVNNLANTQPSAGATQAQTNLNNQATGANPAATNINTLTGIGLYGSPQVQEAMKQEQGLVNQQGSIASGNALAAIDSGRAANVQTSINSAAQLLANAQAQQASQINAASAGGTQQLTGQAQQIGAANNAGSLANTAQQNQITGQTAAQGATQPVAGATIFGSPQTGGLVGQGVNTINTAVQNAVNQVMSGSTTADALATLNQFNSPVASQQFIQQMRQYDPNWSISGSNATATQNWNQVQTYQGQASNLQNGISNLANAGTLATNFLNSEPTINPTQNPTLNNAIDTYVSSFKNPSSVASYNTIMGDIQKFQSQILSSNSGITPTGTTAQVLSQDPTKLTPSQLVPFMNTLAQLGGNQLSTIQGQIKTIMSGGATPYAGNPTSVNTSPNPGPASTTGGPGGGGVRHVTESLSVQAGVGGVMNAGLGGAAAGTAVLGLAEKVLGAL